MRKDELQLIVNETVKTFGAEEWFRNVTVYPSHPVTGEPTLEFKVNYVPILGPVRKLIIEFAQRFNLKEKFVIVDKAGAPVE